MTTLKKFWAIPILIFVGFFVLAKDRPADKPKLSGATLDIQTLNTDSVLQTQVTNLISAIKQAYKNKKVDRTNGFPVIHNDPITVSVPFRWSIVQEIRPDDTYDLYLTIQDTINGQDYLKTFPVSGALLKARDWRSL